MIRLQTFLCASLKWSVWTSLYSLIWNTMSSLFGSHLLYKHIHPDLPSPATWANIVIVLPSVAPLWLHLQKIQRTLTPAGSWSCIQVAVNEELNSTIVYMRVKLKTVSKRSLWPTFAGLLNINDEVTLFSNLLSFTLFCKFELWQYFYLKETKCTF